MIVNAYNDAYKQVNDIRDEEVDSINGSLTNRYYNIVFWQVANKAGEYAPVMMNMPSGSYVGLDSAINDVDGFDSYDIPRQYKEDSATGFLLCRITFRQTTTAITVHNTTDLRGRTPGTASGTALTAGTEFADNQFKIFNVADDTKIVDLDLSGLTSPSTRTITPADADMKIPSAVDHDDLTDGGDTTLHDHDGISENTTHRGSDGKDHSDVGLNNSHRGSDGSDHDFLDQSVVISASPVFKGENFETAEWDKQQNFDEAEITSDTGAVAWNVNNEQCAFHTLTEHTTISEPSNIKAGSTYQLRVIQAAGLYTLAWHAAFEWGVPGVPVAPAADGDVVVFSFYSDGTTIYAAEMNRTEA
jgi:hypothetical protein